MFSLMVTDLDVWKVTVGNPNDPSDISPVGCPNGECSWMNKDNHTAYIFLNDIATVTYHKCGILGQVFGATGRYSTLGALISHELMSHGGAVREGAYNSHAYNVFFRRENEYHAAHGESDACPDAARYR